MLRLQSRLAREVADPVQAEKLAATEEERDESGHIGPFRMPRSLGLRRSHRHSDLREEL